MLFRSIYTFSILVPLYIIPYLYDGGNYISAKNIGEGCKENWIYNLLYVNNFVKDKFCIGWTWYIANDFQMYLLIPIFVLIYRWKAIAGVITVVLLICTSAGVQIQQFMKYHILANISSENYNDKYYIKPYCRINPFLIGVLMAWMYISHKQAKKESSSEGNEEEVYKKTLVNKVNYAIIHNCVLRYSIYIIGFIITSVFVYTFFDFYKDTTTKSDAENYAYTLLSRPLFIIGVAFVIYPGCLGKARVLRTILGYQVFNSLSKVV